jgi:hypothetical protein
MNCPNKLDESNQPCGDEGWLCEACEEREAKYWWNYFGGARGHEAFGAFYGWNQPAEPVRS